MVRGAYKGLIPGGFLELYDSPFSYLSASDDGALWWKSVSWQACELGKKTGCSFAIDPGMYTCHMAAAGFVDIQEKWETAEVTNFVLHEVESMLRLSWYLEGVDDQEIWARLAHWRGRLKSEAGSVRVRSMCLFLPQVASDRRHQLTSFQCDSMGAKTIRRRGNVHLKRAGFGWGLGRRRGGPGRVVHKDGRRCHAISGLGVDPARSRGGDALASRFVRQCVGHCFIV